MKLLCIYVEGMRIMYFYESNLNLIVYYHILYNFFPKGFIILVKSKINIITIKCYLFLRSLRA